MQQLESDTAQKFFFQAVNIYDSAALVESI